MSDDVENELFESITHPLVRSTDGTAWGILDAINHQAKIIVGLMDQISATLRIDTAVGDGLDQIGLLLSTKRSGDTDEEFRTRLLSYVTTYNKQNTITAIKDVVEWITGYRPDVNEYFDAAGAQYLLDKYGIDYNLAVFEIPIPWNYRDKVNELRPHVDRVKAAGVKAIIEVFNFFVIQLDESIFVDDRYIHMKYTAGFEEHLALVGAVFDTGKFDTDTDRFGGAYPSPFGIDFWIYADIKEVDSVSTPIDDLTSVGVFFTEPVSAPTDVFFGEPHGYFTESLSTPVVSFLLDGTQYETDSLPTPDDIFGGVIDYNLVDSVSAPVATDVIGGLIKGKFTEAFAGGVFNAAAFDLAQFDTPIGNIADVFGLDGTLSFSEVPSVPDDSVFFLDGTLSYVESFSTPDDTGFYINLLDYLYLTEFVGHTFDGGFFDEAKFDSTVYFSDDLNIKIGGEDFEETVFTTVVLVLNWEGHFYFVEDITTLVTDEAFALDGTLYLTDTGATVVDAVFFDGTMKLTDSLGTPTDTPFNYDLVQVEWRFGDANAIFGTVKFGGQQV